MPNNNNNNNATVPANSNANNDPQENDPHNNNNNNNNAKSKSSAEGTRRVNPGTGKAKSAAQIRAAVNMKRAKTLINEKLSIKSRAHEFNPLIKIMKRENFANAAAKEAAINDYIEQLRQKREAQSGTKKASAAKNTTSTNKPKRKYVRKPKANAAPAVVPSPASTATTEKKEKKKVTNPSNSQLKYKSNMTAAKKYLNDALSIKSMPPEYNPLVKYMRNDKLSEEERKAAMNAHVETIRAARAEKASKKATKGGSRKSRKNVTRKNRRS